MRPKNPNKLVVASRVEDLIKELGTTQEKVADRAAELGHKLTRIDVNKVCRGVNQATTEKIRSGLAAGLEVARPDLDDYLAGKISLHDVLRRRLRLVSSPAAAAETSGQQTLTWGQLDGWAEAEHEAIELSHTLGMPPVLAFYGARSWPVLGIPEKVTPRFVHTVAWLWDQTADDVQRAAAARAQVEELSRPRANK